MAENVQDYGAAGDGQSDDTNAIRTAAAAAGSGGVVYFPAGTYVVGKNSNSPLKYDDSWGELTFQGEAYDSTTIRLASGHSSWHFLFQSESGQFPGARFEQLTLDANKSGNGQAPGSHCLYIENGSGTLTLRDTVVANPINAGVLVQDRMSLDVRYTHFKNCGDPSRNAAHAVNPNPDSPQTVLIRDTLFQNTAGADIDVGSDSTNKYVTVEVIRCYSEGSPRFIKLDPENDKTTVRNTRFIGGSGAVASLGIVSNNNNYNCGSLELTDVVIERTDYPGIDLGSGTDISLPGMDTVTIDNVALIDVDNDNFRSPGKRTSTGLYAEAAQLDVGTVSVHDVGSNNDGDALWFWDGASGTIDELRHDGTSKVGNTDGVTVVSAQAGAAPLTPDVVSISDVGPRASTDSAPSDGTSDGSTTTPTYGGYQTPSAGTLDWHVPLNENFQSIEADIQDIAKRLETLEGK